MTFQNDNQDILYFLDKSSITYEFVIKYYNSMRVPHDYGNGDSVNMMEAHLLLFICENPGITVSGLAKFWGTSKGAISTQIKLLESKGYILKYKNPQNAKIINLTATKAGQELTNYHKIYDNVGMGKLFQNLLKSCSVEDIQSFFKVVDAYTQFLDTVAAKRKSAQQP